MLLLLLPGRLPARMVVHRARPPAAAAACTRQGRRHSPSSSLSSSSDSYSKGCMHRTPPHVSTGVHACKGSVAERCPADAPTAGRACRLQATGGSRSAARPRWPYTHSLEPTHPPIPTGHWHACMRGEVAPLGAGACIQAPVEPAGRLPLPLLTSTLPFLAGGAAALAAGLAAAFFGGASSLSSSLSSSSLSSDSTACVKENGREDGVGGVAAAPARQHRADRTAARWRLSIS